MEMNAYYRQIAQVQHDIELRCGERWVAFMNRSPIPEAAQEMGQASHTPSIQQTLAQRRQAGGEPNRGQMLHP